jgi:TRAP-type C4-dicarboxylate transport system permease small subunit
MTSLDAAVRILEAVLSRIAQTALFIMMIAVVLDSGGRYLFNHPLSGVYEATELYLMIAVVFLAIGQTQRLGGHVRVELLLERLPVALQRALEIIYLLATMAVFAVAAYASMRMCWQAFADGRWTAGVVPLPTGPSWTIVAIGLAALCVRLLIQAMQIVRGDDAYTPDGSQSHH